jgi:hypothetical protein
MSFNIRITFERFPPVWIQLNATDTVRDIINFVGNRYRVPVENLIVNHFGRFPHPNHILGPLIGIRGTFNRFMVNRIRAPVAPPRLGEIGPYIEPATEFAERYGLGLAGALSRGGGGGGARQGPTPLPSFSTSYARSGRGGGGARQGPRAQPAPAPPMLQRSYATDDPRFSVGGRGRGGRQQQQGGRGGRGGRGQQGRGGRGGRGQQGQREDLFDRRQQDGSGPAPRQ